MKIAIVGAGQTALSGRSGLCVAELGVQAARSALGDAGIAAESVDLVVPIGGCLFAEDLISGLRLSLNVRDVWPPPGGNSTIAALALAKQLLESQAAEVALLVFARNGSSEARIRRRVNQLPGGVFREQLELPHGWSLPAQWYSMICRRHMHEFGTTKEQLGAVAVTMREHAQLNPGAMMYGRPLDLDDYLASPMIADPYQLCDCCLETDGGAAVVLRADTTQRTHPAVLLCAAETARPESADDLTNRADWLDIGLTAAAPAAFAAASIEPKDVDLALVYDCFTFEVLHQLEEAGFCGRGEAGPLAAKGQFRLGGALPVNPHGGLLSEGHLLGMNHVIEAVRQLRGDAGRRQVEKARWAAVTGWGDLGDGGLALLGA